MKVLLLGGTRFVGVRVSQFLANAGAEVTVFHRGITGSPVGGVSSIIGDRSQPEGLEALGDARFDAVLDLSGYFSDWTRAASEVLTGRVAHYVFVSSGAVYRPSAEFPWRESTPFGPNPIWGRYGEEKVESERILWRAYEQGRFAVTCFRFPFILGPGNFADSRILRLLPARGRSSHSSSGRGNGSQPVRIRGRCCAFPRRGARAPRRCCRSGIQLRLQSSDHEPRLGEAVR